MEKGIVVLTGITGMYGKALAKKLISQGYTLIALGRGLENLDFQTRISQIFSSSESRAIEPIEVDVSDKKSVGDLYKTLKKCKIELIINAAANLSFKERNSDAVIKFNTSSTENMLGLSTLLGAPLIHISTAFVHGTRRGELSESKVLGGSDFNNSYEKSKWMCEEILFKNGVEQPINIIRPGIIIDRHKYSGEFGYYVFLDALLKLRKWINNFLHKNFNQQTLWKNKHIFIPLPFLYSKRCKMDFIELDILVDFTVRFINSNAFRSKRNNILQLSNSPHSSVEDVLKQTLEGLKMSMILIPTNIKLANLYIDFLCSFSRFFTPLKTLTNRLRIFRYYITQNYYHDSKEATEFYNYKLQNSKFIFREITSKAYENYTI